MQAEFDFPLWSQRDRWISDFDFDRLPRNGRAVSGMVLCAVLRHLSKYKVECYEHQDNIAESCKIKSVRTVQAAIRVLRESDLITTERKWRGHGLLNHHRVNWGELQRAITAQTATENEPDQPDNLDRPTRQSAPDQPDNLDRVTRQLVPSDPTIGTDQPDNLRAASYRRELREETTTTAHGTTEAGPNDTTDLVVVVSDCGVGDKEAVKRARGRGLDDGAILEFVRRWKELPASDRRAGDPGVLHNWLIKDGSYTEPRAQASTMLRGDGMSKNESRRSGIEFRICRHWQKSGKFEWSEEELRRAVDLAESASESSLERV